MRLHEYLDPELVVIGLRTSGMEDTIAALVDHVARFGLLKDPEVVREAVVEREKSHTTSLGNGVALPHATVAAVGSPVIAVATAPEGVAFGPSEVDARPDRLIFLLLSPLDAAGTHIKLLARIVRLVRSEGFVRTLVAAESGEALIEAIEREDALHV